MSWPRVSLLASLLVIALPQAFADAIKVNTTNDDGSASVCSLRSAVEYFNQGRPDAGWKGCKRDGEASATDSIQLESNAAAYAINSTAIALHLDRNLSITGAGSSGDKITRIKVNGAHRAFVMNNSATYAPPVCSVTCQPAGAPPLDPASDTGASPTDFLTTVNRPLFNGTATAPSDPSNTIRIILYAKRADMTAAKQVGMVLADPSTYNWAVSPDEDLSPGEYKFTYATQLLDNSGNKVGAEVPSSAATTLRIYADPAVTRTISLTSVAIEGCGLADCATNVNDTGTYTVSSGLSFTNNLTGTLGKGGVIFSTEGLSISSVVITKGVASGNGGAIFVGGGATSLVISTSTLSDNTATGSGGAVFADAGVSTSLDGTLLEKNKAATGGAIATTDTGLVISASSIIKNESTAAAGATLATGTSGNFMMTNSTISGNTGWAILMHGGTINASTIVDNSLGGIDFASVNANVHNSILAGNPTTASVDCANLPGTLTMSFDLLVTGAGCPVAGTGIQQISNTAGTDQQLMACDATLLTCNRSFGLLNPLGVGDKEDKLLPFHLPRMLSSYGSVASSPIINKGAGSSGVLTVGCPGNDQRGKPRFADVTDYCDIGAVEVKVTTDIARSGGSIGYNAVYYGALDQGLGDEELFTGTCPASPPVATAIQYDPTVPGCPWLETVPPRGQIAFHDRDALHPYPYYTYTPNAPFHGYDEFRIRVMTTLSHLNTEPAQKGRPVLAKVIVQPNSGITESSVGGSVSYGIFGILALLGLARTRKGQSV